MSLLFSISQCIRRHVVHIRTRAFPLLSTASLFNFPFLHKLLETIVPVGCAVGVLLRNPPNAPKSWARVFDNLETTNLLLNHCSFGEWPVCMLQACSSADLLNAPNKPRHQQTATSTDRALPEQAFGVEHLLTFKHPQSPTNHRW